MNAGSIFLITMGTWLTIMAALKAVLAHLALKARVALLEAQVAPWAAITRRGEVYGPSTGLLVCCEAGHFYRAPAGLVRSGACVCPVCPTVEQAQ